MLEKLLKLFRSYGMDDLEFIIVNSKLSHSQEKLYELEKRVSFSVYQETDDEEVWSVMEGGKDDMFVYDRCGRLSYYVPFPLSILNETPLVSNAILATYFRSPCGVTCGQNDTLNIEEINNLENDLDNATHVSEDANDFTITEQYAFENETEVNESSNNLLSVIDSANQSETSNSSDSNNITDYDYSSYNDTGLQNYTDINYDREVSGYFNLLYRLFFNTVTNNDNESNIQNNDTLKEVPSNETDIQSENNTLHNGTVYLHHQHHQQVINKTKQISDRCVEADSSVCKSWSKKRLLHAQKCCSPESQTLLEVQDHRSCNNFGKRRCKKIQSILKCCIKTLYTESTTETPVTEVTTTMANEIMVAVCCKNTDLGKFCRVAEAGVCLEEEFLEDSPRVSNCTDLPPQNERSSEEKVLKST